MELFRIRETKEFMSLDELKEKCDIVDQHMDMLQVPFEIIYFFLYKIFKNI